ncbi:MAG TPA: PEP/pyruvate-binding domain-containing protein [Candidatus Limnocylindria bacterium]
MLVRPLAALASSDIAIAGGKGANLGELMRAGFAVPDGFIVTTDAYRLAAAQLDPSDPAAIAQRLRSDPVPDAVATAVRDAYRALGGMVAVRSSATAEDLPEASFAGQQDTFLGVQGEDAVVDALRRCWASLWNGRAISYRSTHGVSTSGLALAVVVQRLVRARSAGVLFTADPLTGRRRRAVVDAVRGLGERLVSGAANPDHFVVDAQSGEILERHGDAIDDARLSELAGTGARIEEHFGRPQDIEWAVDAERLWIVQSRDITTLYPLPDGLPDPDADLRVFLSANVAQGVFQPLTPMGLQTFRLIGSAFATAVGKPPADVDAGTSILRDSGMRLWIDLTPLMRNSAVREMPARAMSVMEARSEGVFRALLADPRLAARGGSRPRTALTILGVLRRVGVISTIARAALRPDAARERLYRDLRIVDEADPGPTATALERVAAFERLVLTVPPRLFPRLVAPLVVGLFSYNAAGRLLRSVATQDEMRTVLRGLPYNPTTEMDLALWSIAQRTRGDPAAEERALGAFLERYGHRAVAEIDLGLPRWADDPSYLRSALAGYRRLDDAALAPDAQFARGAREAEAMIAALLSRVRGPRRVVARALLHRVRALAGLREMPKFQIIRLFGRVRGILAPVGDELAAAGRIARGDDLWFLTLPEMRRGLGGEDLRAVVVSRRAEYVREMRRRHVPRILLSDGTDAEAAYAPPAVGAIRGTPASPGVATGVARVLRSPGDGQLEPGEILVAPATDPGWTPLFLTAGALVMEMGGMMSHGAVVAREYGIPAVVGVPGATDRIATGQRITVDGSAGTVSLGDG